MNALLLALIAVAAEPVDLLARSGSLHPDAGSQQSQWSDPARDRAPHWHKPDASASTLAQRIVSLAPVVTETLFVLGAGARVVGVTRFCDRPAAASTRTVVGGYTDASLEKILELKPDLVIAMPSFQQRALLDRLRERNIAVFVVFTDAIDEENAMMLALGDLVGAPEQARALVHKQQATLEATTRSAKGKGHRAVVVVGHDPLVVAGTGTFADVALRATGAESALLPGDPAWPVWSLEALLARQVAVVVAAEGPEAADRLRASFAPLGARAPRVVAAGGSILMRPGPSFADDVVTLEKLFAPSPAGGQPRSP
ncbi:MAG: helical backbone metal receptor [Deltaproteobacteria bacterium]|nr:helical backbone metal receptor [Deltaproteobacteria bacterium]